MLTGWDTKYIYFESRFFVKNQLMAVGMTKFVLKDKKGEEFPIQTDLFCRSYIMNGHLKNNLDQQAQLKKQGFGHFRADLSLEDYAQSVAVITALIKGESLFVSDATRGHFNRGIE